MNTYAYKLTLANKLNLSDASNHIDIYVRSSMRLDRDRALTAARDYPDGKLVDDPNYECILFEYIDGSVPEVDACVIRKVFGNGFCYLPPDPRDVGYITLTHDVGDHKNTVMETTLQIPGAIANHIMLRDQEVGYLLHDAIAAWQERDSDARQDPCLLDIICVPPDILARYGIRVAVPLHKIAKYDGDTPVRTQTVVMQAIPVPADFFGRIEAHSESELNWNQSAKLTTCLESDKLPGCKLDLVAERKAGKSQVTVKGVLYGFDGAAATDQSAVVGNYAILKFNLPDIKYYAVIGDVTKIPDMATDAVEQPAHAYGAVLGPQMPAMDRAAMYPESIFSVSAPFPSPFPSTAAPASAPVCQTPVPAPEPESGSILRDDVPVVAVKYKYNGIPMSVTIDELARRANLDPDQGTISSVRLSVSTKDGTRLIAEADTDPAHPGIGLNATDADGRTIYLSRAELPNENGPDSLMAFLYAGYADFNADGPIACVRTQLLTPDEADAAERTYEETGKPPIKLVHVMNTLARSVDINPKPEKDGNGNFKEYYDPRKES